MCDSVVDGPARSKLADGLMRALTLSAVECEDKESECKTIVVQLMLKRMQAVPELALMSTTAGGTAQLVAEALRAGEGAVQPDLLDALRGAAGAVLPMDAVQESPQPEAPAPAEAQQTVVRTIPLSANRTPF